MFTALALVCMGSVAYADVIANADANADAESGAASNLTLTQEASKIPMGVVPQDLKFPQLIPYFGPKNPGYRFRPVKDILLYGSEFTLGSLQYGISNTTLEQNNLIRITSPEALKQIVTVIWNANDNGRNKSVADINYNRRGYVMAKALGESSSLDAFQLVLLMANGMGSNTVHLTRQGVDFSMYAKGWGLSLGGVRGSLNADGEGGTVASGMIGYASGKSGANKDPWIQGIALEPFVKVTVIKVKAE